MKALIIEDEINAYEYLSRILLQIRSDIIIVKNLESVKDSLNFLKDDTEVDLIFMDIQLSDGLSFEIFDHFRISTPVIFTTAFDQYALDAFKVHSIDYLLKPIDPDDLQKALKKYQDFYSQDHGAEDRRIDQLLQSLKKPKKIAAWLEKVVILCISMWWILAM